MSEQQPDTADRTVDEQRGKFGSAGWDALDEDDTENATDNPTWSATDVPKPDPAKDQG